MRVVVLVPRRAGIPDRDRIWQWAQARWQADHPDWPIVEGHHNDGPFNRSAAINDAAEKAGDWDVAVVIDADVVANPDAVRTGVELATQGFLVVTHDIRVMLNRSGTQKVLAGWDGPWWTRGTVEKVWYDSVSCSVAVSRDLWDQVGGFDPLFVGWGFEDTAFRIACETMSGRPLLRVSSEVYHLWHQPAPETRTSSPTRQANARRKAAYEAARWDRDAIRRLLDERAEQPPAMTGATIPRILFRTVPKTTTAEVEQWWDRFAALHPGWELRTYREPLKASEWPLTGDLWGRCQNGAQKAGLIRLEGLVRHGGIYVDSDVEPFRSLEPLLGVDAFAGWEDETTVPDFLLGARPDHPAFVEAIARARQVIADGGDAWKSGPGVLTDLLPGRHDVLLLPPGAFAPYHYLQKNRRHTSASQPWAFCAHHWAHSWGTDEQKRSIRAAQRR